MSGGRGANLFWGTMHFLYVFLFSVLLPMLTLNALNNYEIAGIELSFGQENFAVMTWWLFRTGIIMAAFAFFKGSAPKYSRRRGAGAFLETAANVFYIYMYKFSGTSDIRLVGPNLFITLNMDNLLALYMGMILMYIFYNIWDLIDMAIWGRERAEKEIKKQMEKKWKKIMKKRGKMPVTEKSSAAGTLKDALTSDAIQNSQNETVDGKEADSNG